MYTGRALLQTEHPLQGTGAHRSASGMYPNLTGFPNKVGVRHFVNHNLFHWILTEEAAKWHSRPTLSTGKKDTLGAHQCQFSVLGETGKRTFQDPIRDNN